MALTTMLRRHWLTFYIATMTMVGGYWLWGTTTTLPQYPFLQDVVLIVGVLSVYLLSHFLRMLRLSLLTLDKRDAILPLLSSHALTALPSSLLPFKLGEVIRLAGFFVVYKNHKALAVWLAERFGDIVIISLLILLLYMSDAHVPTSLKLLFIVFISCSLLAVVAFFAVSKTFIYLNRYLVLNSTSRRSLVLLKISHQLRLLETTIYQSVQGRFLGLLILSLFIWLCEISAVMLFLKGINIIEISALTHYFTAGLSGLFHNSSLTMNYESLKELILLLLTAVFGGLIIVSKFLKRG